VMKLITTSCIKQLAVLMLCSTIGEAFSSSGARMGDKDLDAAPVARQTGEGCLMSAYRCRYAAFRARGRLSQLSARS
jgi:hypothetical protein